MRWDITYVSKVHPKGRTVTVHALWKDTKKNAVHRNSILRGPEGQEGLNT